ncbi:hypothetical protein BN946_scf184985.g122 [Trametes cinnabarina]|uniref:FAD/NAD(P)-binding domain-containing protein n=1 Tax=Pycnoporus cinnabarinus TaxID=5643 RepID=A0A060SDY3_PYCCI|nr:hypothetical protein BN946_scf184985.g122 [Trametes cinnabarina]
MPGGGLSRPSEPKSVSPESAPYTLGEFCIDEYRPIKVIVVGAGFSGITAGIRFRQKIPNVSVAIYEKSTGVGGAWFNNKYPGLACDIPSICYQLTFEEKRLVRFLPPGAEIRQYLEGIVDKYKLAPHIKLGHEVTHAQYDEPSGKWHVRIRRTHPATGKVEQFEDTGDVLFTAFGSLDRWSWPDIKGLETFKGELHHSAGFDPCGKAWQEVAEAWKDKTVGIIGVGSSAVQLVPALQPRVKKVYNYVRGKTWLAVPFGSTGFAEFLQRDAQNAENYQYTPEELARFKNDERFYKNYRHALETEINARTPMQLQAQQIFRANMEKKLEKKPWILENSASRFGHRSYLPLCRSLTMGMAVSWDPMRVYSAARVPTCLQEAHSGARVDFISSPIKRVTETGIETEDGQHQELDVLFCATGYDATYQLPFKIIGRNGVDISEKWRPHPVTYLSVAVDGFPNMFMALGPNSAVGSGSLLALMEYQVMYAVQAAAKLQRERLRSIEVKPEAVRDYDQYIDSVYSAKCRSWYKGGREEGRVIGLWPGAYLIYRALSYPRWEDYNYERADPIQNRLYWLGDGQTYAEKTLTGERAWYLRPPYLDVPPVPGDEPPVQNRTDAHGAPSAQIARL